VDKPHKRFTILSRFNLTRKIKLSSRFLEMSEIYKIFSKDWDNDLDFSEKALIVKKV
jgi:hypothetical protein